MLLAALMLTACKSGGKAPADMAFVAAFAPHDKVDILFVLVDFAISPKRMELVSRFPQLLHTLDGGPPASYHIGVITSDLGAGPFTLGSATPTATAPSCR